MPSLRFRNQFLNTKPFRMLRVLAHWKFVAHSVLRIFQCPKVLMKDQPLITCCLISGLNATSHSYLVTPMAQVVYINKAGTEFLIPYGAP
jgi:hypothetical protein